MRDKIWKELCQARFSYELTQLYAENAIFLKKYSTIFILIFSTSGIIGWKIWDKYPIIVCVITLIISVFKLIQQHIFSDEKIKTLNKINCFYFCYFNDFDRLWIDINDNSIENEKAKNKYFKIKKTEKSIINDVNEIILKPKKRQIKKAEKLTTKYLINNYNVQKYE